jgi:hypothetical protein
VRVARAQLGEQAFSSAWAEGQRMTVEQAFAMQGQPITSQGVSAKLATQAGLSTQASAKDEACLYTLAAEREW